MSAAIAEAYAAAPVDGVIYHTLELWHPAFAAPIRVVRDEVALDARLEAGAPRNAGEVVTFVAYAFDIVPPDQNAEGLPQAVIEIDNVSREILVQLDAAVASGQPVTAIYRQYLSDALLDGPEYDPPMELAIQSLSATALRIRATCGFPNLIGLRFPRLEFDIESYPGLQP
jgi:hypothetical protein